ncbi:MAG TPA: hypothetical protein VEI97_06460, partial [bacterium]|nr:hypothetical protein [bacterium]
MVVGVAQSATPHRPAGPMVCRCAICGQEVPEAEVEEAGNIRLQLAKFIAARHPSAWNAKCKVCWPCLNSERASY